MSLKLRYSLKIATRRGIEGLRGVYDLGVITSYYRNLLSKKG